MAHCSARASYHGVTSRDRIDVVVSHLDVEAEVVRASAALLSEDERQRASRLIFDRDRRRFIVARSRLRQLLGARLGVRPESVVLVYGERGKPALAPSFASDDLQFNVSHADAVVVYAFTLGRAIGVDIEASRVIPDADAIAARWFSSRENETYLSLDPRDRPLGFFNCWTRKEAFIKGLGDGLAYPLDRFDVSLAPGEPARILRVYGVTEGQLGWTLHSFSPGPGLIGAIAAQTLSPEADATAGAESVIVHAPPQWFGLTGPS